MGSGRAWGGSVWLVCHISLDIGMQLDGRVPCWNVPGWVGRVIE